MKLPLSLSALLLVVFLPGGRPPSAFAGGPIDVSNPHYRLGINGTNGNSFNQL
jgi:hypothetical protein